MCEQSFDLHVDDITDVDDRVRRAERHEEERLRLVRLQSLLLPELRQHLARRRIRVDRAQDHF